MRKTIGAIAGFVVLFGLLLVVAFHIWPTTADVSESESQALAEFRQRLITVDDLEQRGILSEEIAESERQHYAVQAQAALSKSHLQALVEVKYKIATIDDLQKRGILTAEVAEAEKRRYLVEVQNIAGETLDTNQLAILIQHLDSRQIIEAGETSPSSTGLSVPVIVWILAGISLILAAGWFIQAYRKTRREQPSTRRSPDRMATSAVPLTATIAPDGEPAPQPPPAEPLTRRELEVLELVAQGLTNREIAQKLTITPGTAKVHVSNIYGKLGVNRRVQAITRAQELGILSTAQ